MDGKLDQSTLLSDFDQHLEDALALRKQQGKPGVPALLNELMDDGRVLDIFKARAAIAKMQTSGGSGDGYHESILRLFDEVPKNAANE